MRIRKLSLALAGAVAAVALVGSASPAMAGDFVWSGEKFWFKSDCTNRGAQGVARHEWLEAVCINGSPLPGDDYELWVRYN